MCGVSREKEWETPILTSEESGRYAPRSLDEHLLEGVALRGMTSGVTNVASAWYYWEGEDEDAVKLFCLSRMNVLCLYQYLGGFLSICSVAERY